MNRFKAAGIHLGISCIIALITFLLLWWVWYPGALFTLMGGLALLIILLGVDVVIGPLITLIIFNTQKKSLKWDLMCVALLQTAALAYGIYTLWMARPIWVAYHQGEFRVVALPDITGKLSDTKYKDLKTLPTLGPKVIGIASENELRGQFDVELGIQSGAHISVFPQGWKPYDMVKAEVLSKSMPLEKLALKENGKVILAKLQTRYSGQAKPPLWLPLIGRFGEGIVLLDPITGVPIETIAL